MLRDLLIAALGIGAMVVGWVAVQAAVRRRDPEVGPDGDVLACRMCDGKNGCTCGLKALRRKEPDTHE